MTNEVKRADVISEWGRNHPRILTSFSFAIRMKKPPKETITLKKTAERTPNATRNLGSSKQNATGAKAKTFV